ncbi:hypothetical protein [Cetobacterium ceti]
MIVKIIINSDKYVSDYALIGDIENSLKISLPDNSKDFFINNYMFHKLIDKSLVFDSKKKDEFEKNINMQQQEHIKNQLMILFQKQQFFKSKNWSTNSIDEEISNLENTLQTLTSK